MGVVLAPICEIHLTFKRHPCGNLTRTKHFPVMMSVPTKELFTNQAG
jgi:hypothetical protein